MPKSDNGQKSDRLRGASHADYGIWLSCDWCSALLTSTQKSSLVSMSLLTRALHNFSWSRFLRIQTLSSSPWQSHLIRLIPRKPATIMSMATLPAVYSCYLGDWDLLIKTFIALRPLKITSCMEGRRSRRRTMAGGSKTCQLFSSRYQHCLEHRSLIYAVQTSRRPFQGRWDGGIDYGISLGPSSVWQWRREGSRMCLLPVIILSRDHAVIWYWSYCSTLSVSRAHFHRHYIFLIKCSTFCYQCYHDLLAILLSSWNI